jgi:hypothetical protein
MIVVPRSKRGTESNGIAAKYSDGEVVRIYGPRQGQSRWFDTTRVCFSTASVSRPSAGATVGLLSAKGGCRRRVDGTAGLPSAPEMPYAPRQLRLVPDSDTRSRLKCAPTVTPLRFPYRIKSLFSVASRAPAFFHVVIPAVPARQRRGRSTSRNGLPELDRADLKLRNLLAG